MKVRREGENFFIMEEFNRKLSVVIRTELIFYWELFEIGLRVFFMKAVGVKFCLSKCFRLRLVSGNLKQKLSLKFISTLKSKLL